MRIFYLILVLIAHCFICQAININGTYINEYGNKIIISGNKFIYIEKQPPTHNTWENDTLAVCEIKKIRNNVLEINSLNVFDMLYKTLELDYSHTYSKKDSTKIVVECPYNKSRLNIIISIEDSFPFKFYHNSRFCDYIYIPKNTKQFMLDIYPDSINNIHTIRGQSFGLQEIRLLTNLDVGEGDVVIKIPILDNHFFERYFIENEYIYIEENKIYWKGNVYKKVAITQKSYEHSTPVH